ncbi:glycosyl hydrolase [Thozetella sp. PMI_491]|nr:glycosyl hydrolase [Thozetella sp. PMI_491]
MLVLDALAALLGLAIPVRAATCASNLLVDNFSSWSTHANSLGVYTSDDNTMSSISAASGTLTFTPKANSYLYENLPCQTAKTSGYNAVSFSLQGPAGSSITFGIQACKSCSTTKYTDYYYTLSGLSGTPQTIVVPLSSFTGANLDALTAFTWSGFSKTGVAWKLSNVQLVCGSTSQPASSAAQASSSATSGPTSSSTSSSPAASTGCSSLLIDDWVSQSRLTFLGYNALLQPSSDDGSMKSVVVSQNTVTLTPLNTNSYFYSQLGCINAKNLYGGVSLRIKAAAGTTFIVQLQSTTACGKADSNLVSVSSTTLGWKFDGTSQLYTIPFSQFNGIDLTKLNTVYFGSFNKAVTFGPMEAYCGNSGAEYTVPPTSVPAGPSYTVPAPAGPSPTLLVDQFAGKDSNALGFWHGADDGMTLTWGNKKLTIVSKDSDLSFYTQFVGGGCSNLVSKYAGSYLHVAFTGSNKFTIALQQHNPSCSDTVSPFPETWDSLEAARYTNAAGTDIYIPMSHFNIDLARAVGLAFKGFYTSNPTVLTKIELVPSIPGSVTIPNKLPSGNLVFGCKRPNSFAFAIDDGDPTLAQQVVDIVKAEGINVTFFTVGAPLEDPTTNLSSVYKNMKAQGHQIALHSFTHPKMEGLPDYASIDWEYNNDITAMKQTFGEGFFTPYFRPPFGNEGARMRQRLAQTLGTDNPYLVMWNVDVEDWLWAQSSTPQKQLDAFNRDVNNGGSLVVMHYLYPSTVGYLRQFIQIAKATGKQLMRVDQCMMDPNAPPL